MNASRNASLAVLAFTLTLVYGIWYAYGVVIVALLHEFGWSRSVLAGAFSVFTLVHGVANPVIGWLCARVPPARVVGFAGVLLALALLGDSFIRTPAQLYVAFGVCTALAVAGSGWIPALVQTQQRFPDRLGFAIGVVSSGVGVGMLLVVPLVQFLIEHVGWRGAFRVLALLCVCWIVPASIYLARTAPAAGSSASSGSAQPRLRARPRGQVLTVAQAIRTTAFWLIMAASFFGNVCAQTLHVHQVAFLVDHGVTTMAAASVVGVVGAASIFAKIAGGWVSDRIDREIVYITCIAILVSSVVTLFLVGRWPSVWGAYGYAILLGIGYSVTASLLPAMASDRFAGPHFGAIIGLGLLGSALGSAFGPWLAGWLFDRFDSYAYAFAVAATCGAAGWALRRLRLSQAGN